MTRPTIDHLRSNAPSVAVTGTTIAGLVLVAPLEHALGLALGLSWWHAWAVTALVEGAAGAAIIAGHYIGAALTLTGGSVLIGTLWSAAEQVRVDHATNPDLHPAATLADDPARAAAAVGLTVLAVSGLALVHRVRARINAARTAIAEQAARREAEQARQDREHAARMARLEDERETKRLAAHSREADAQRRHDADMARQRAYAEQERVRLDAQAAVARAELERSASDRARAEADRARAEASRQERAPRAAPRRTAAPRPSAPDDITARRARAEWDRAELAGAPLTGAQLGALLGVTEGAARKIAQRWRNERAETTREASAK